MSGPNFVSRWSVRDSLGWRRELGGPSTVLITLRWVAFYVAHLLLQTHSLLNRKKCPVPTDNEPFQLDLELISLFGSWAPLCIIWGSWHIPPPQQVMGFLSHFCVCVSVWSGWAHGVASCSLALTTHCLRVTVSPECFRGFFWGPHLKYWTIAPVRQVTGFPLATLPETWFLVVTLRRLSLLGRTENSCMPAGPKFSPQKTCSLSQQTWECRPTQGHTQAGPMLTLWIHGAAPTAGRAYGAMRVVKACQGLEIMLLHCNSSFLSEPALAPW